jgi:riboflavin synthase
MFTGLVETVGTISQIRRVDKSIKLGIIPKTAGFEAPDGSSVCINGVCLTVESTTGGALFFTAVNETLQRTTLASARPAETVNLERAIAVGGRLDGHFVLGHVDGVGAITGDRPVGDSVERRIRAPLSIGRLLARKGSVAIDGISLTIADIADEHIVIALIPATLESTTMGRKKPGDLVNIECDVVARYIERLLGRGPQDLRSDSSNDSGSLVDKLERLGF